MLPYLQTRDVRSLNRKHPAIADEVPFTRAGAVRELVIRPG
jgi:hypothetical protein